MTILRAREIGKAFRNYKSEWHRVARWFGINTTPADENWVLKHINLEITPGESFGIVGQNGAGKSTLLKIITGTLQPTEGTVEVRGQLASILELGMGFNAELTGRQNAYHTAGLMGFKISKINDIIDDIESFSDIGDYFDQPLRTYSSGMQMRVAFSVATSFRPDLLIVDEALSVGDTAFQRKCFRRIEEFQSEGMSLIFVSHDTESVKKHCERAVYLKNGKIVGIGDAKEICDIYESELFSEGSKEFKFQTQHYELPDTVSNYDASLRSTSEMIYGNGKAEIEYCWLENELGEKINIVEAGRIFRWCYKVKFNVDVKSPIFAMMIKTRDGITIFGTDSTVDGNLINDCKFGNKIKVVFEISNHIAPGEYFLNAGIREAETDGLQFLCRRVDASIIRVISGSNSTVLTGLVDLDTRLTLVHVVE